MCYSVAMATKYANKQGRSSNDDYRQASAWIPKDIFFKVQTKLLRPDGRFEYSALVEHLLREWLKDGAKLPE
jgi:hypothetical protein